MSSTEVIPAPTAKTRMDRLFVTWLSKKSTQEYLMHELKRVLVRDDSGSDPLPSPRNCSCSPTNDEARGLSPSTPPAGASTRAYRKTKNNLLVAKSSKKSSAPKSKLVKAESVKQSTPPSVVIPPFYFPYGRPTGESRLGVLKDVHKAFKTFPKGEATLEDFTDVVKICGLPFYWRMPLFLRCAGKNSAVSYSDFKHFWTKMMVQHHDEASQFVCVMTGLNPARHYLVPEDFVDLVQDVVDTHPGLTFLSSTPEFHARYVETVIERIFYSACHNWHYRLTIQDIRKSKLLQAVKDICHEPDINQEVHFFSYEHFYVLYCKFWELDGDHDLAIDAEDLSTHGDHVLCPKVIDRILSGVVTSKESAQNNKMSYREFVWFLISEEDKTSWRSIEYWFRVLDVDGDGYLSIYELEYFYSEMLDKMDTLGVEGLPLHDSMCQVLDMVNPNTGGAISLREVKQCKMASTFINTFVNVDKYLDFEQRDPVGANSKLQEPTTDWEKYASEQYEQLIAEDEQEENEEGSDDDLLPEDRTVLSLA